MIQVQSIRSSKYSQNRDRYPARDNLPCIACGKPVTSADAKMVHLHEGGAAIVTDEEAAILNASGREAADMYMYPIGADCLRKHPELKPYVQ